MGIKSFIKDFFGKKTVIKGSDIVTAFNRVNEIARLQLEPMINTIIKDTPKQLDSKENKVISNLLKLSNTKFSTGTKFMDAMLQLFIQFDKENDSIGKLIKKEIGDFVTDKTINTRQVAIIAIIKEYTNMCLFAHDLINTILIKGVELPEVYNAHKLKLLDYCSVEFMTLFNKYYNNLNSIIDNVPNISNEIVNYNLTSVEIMVRNNSKELLGPSASRFNGNPIYHIRMWLVERDMKKIELLKEKKKLIELRIQELRLNEKGLEDAKLKEMITYYEERISDIEYDITKLSE